jgi:hypothetical protein
VLTSREQRQNIAGVRTEIGFSPLVRSADQLSIAEHALSIFFQKESLLFLKQAEKCPCWTKRKRPFVGSR